MENTDERSGAIPMASPSPSFSKVREEGELSSDDEELPVQSVAQSTGAVVVEAEAVSANPIDKNSLVAKAGKSFPTSNPGNSVDFQSQSSLQPTDRKNFDKSRLNYKSGVSRWYPPAGTDNNLVIRFSDDDSGSDSGEYLQGKALKGKGNVLGVNGKRKPPSSLLAKSEMLRHNTQSETRLMPKKVPLSRTFVSSMAKISRSNFRGARPSSVEQGSCARNSSAPTKIIVNRDRGCNQGMILDNSKLQDLREQIAIRERELKLKSAQQNTETVSGVCRDHKVMSLSKDAPGKGSAHSADVLESEAKEPDKKRLKFSKPYPVQMNPENPPVMPAAKTMLALKDSASEKTDLNNRSKADYCRSDGEIHVRVHSAARMQSRNVRQQKQDDKEMDVPLGTVPGPVNDGADINANCCWPEGSTRQDPHVVLSHQTVPLNMGPIRFQKKVSREESNHTPEASPNNASLWNCLSLQSLLDMEELQDKELEEAQEYRHRCEIEERNALKAYRKAQSALIEANARCNHLYRQREHFSSRFQSLLTDDSSLLLSSRQREHVEVQLNSTNNIFGRGLVPMSIHQRPEYDSNIHHLNSAPIGTSSQHADGQNLGSDPCSDPDGSMSELLPSKGNSIANGVCSNDPNISADDDDTFSFNLESIQPSPEYQSKGEGFEERGNDANDNLKRRFPVNSGEESLRLEASLRSKLFARLGMRSLLKNTGLSCDSVDPADERGAENYSESEKGQVVIGKFSYTEAEKPQSSDIGGTAWPEENVAEVPVQTDDQFASYPSVEPQAEENKVGEQSKCVNSSSPSILRSAFGQMKVTSPSISIEVHSRNQENQTSDIHNQNQQIQTSDVHNQGRANNSSEKIQPSSLIANVRETVSDLSVKEIGSYSCNLQIDSFWPLCMYELRGKCNDEECPWQHVKDCSSRIMNQKDGAAQSFGQWLEKSFSTPWSVSRFLQRELAADAPVRHDRDGRNEAHGNWSSLSSYFQSGIGGVNQSVQDLADNIQYLESALLILNQDNKIEGIKKALSVLSRALEVDPTSVVVWIVYLLIYYGDSDKKSIGKDDLYFYAVKHNEESYELWLLYINSRLWLDDQLVAYDAALSALCRQASAPDSDEMHTSACILDLFLQMMDCLCMSGNVRKAIQRIYGLFPSADISNESHSLLLSDIYACLMISDKCIFWVCCVYLVIYRKLPDAVVQQFECEKELSSVEWPSIQLEVDEKQQAVKLMDMAVDSVESCIKSETPKSVITVRSVHHLILSHIRCIVALDGECSRSLLDKYIKLYPSCLELVLLSARAQQNDSKDLSFAGFEEVLHKWPKEVPGYQCIWNQYAQYARNLAKDVMIRWFDSVWKVQSCQREALDVRDGDNSHCSSDSASVSDQNALNSYSNQLDVTYGFLNLAMYKLLLNDRSEARLAFNSALNAAAPENYKHCVRGHAMFLQMGSSMDGASLSEIVNILKSYLVQARNITVSEPLSRRFIQSIKRTRVQKLISDILRPVSSDFSLVNLVLEVWYGPSLLPESKPKDLVDFVEAVMDIAPSNYQLASSVCKYLIRKFNSSDITSASLLYWASSVLVNAIFQAVPVAPEFVFVEASGVLCDIEGVQAICQMFHKRALTVYPFSIKLWKSYLNLSKTTGDSSAVVEAAREKGIELD